MRKIFILICFLLCQQISYAQGDGGGRVRNMRVKYVTEKMALPTEQNQRFWQVYNRYLDERATLRQIYKDQFAAKGNDGMDKFQANRYVDESIEYKEKDLELSKKYKNELLKVINSEQLAHLYQVEREFKQHLIETLKSK